MNGLKKIYIEAPAAGKVIIIAFIALLFVLLLVVLKKAFAAATRQKTSVDAAEDELKQLNDAGQVPNYPESQYKIWADGLEQAMAGQGTDEAGVASYFRFMQNKADVLALIKAFGTRDYTDDKLLLWNVKPFTLPQWIGAEMSENDRDEYINNQLQSRAINYTF